LIGGSQIGWLDFFLVGFEEFPEERFVFNGIIGDFLKRESVLILQVLDGDNSFLVEFDFDRFGLILGEREGEEIFGFFFGRELIFFLLIGVGDGEAGLVVILHDEGVLILSDRERRNTGEIFFGFFPCPIE
jgi:hypothetical protein